MTDAQARAAGAALALKFYEAYGRPAKSWLRYGQVRPMDPYDLFETVAKKGHGHIDCSRFATGVFYGVGAPDPNGRGYDGQGFTGTLVATGERFTGPAKALDLAFYGDPYNTSGHVAVCINANEVVSFGHTPVERYPIRYRSDFYGLRRYEVVVAAPTLHFLEEVPWTAGGRGPRRLGPWLDSKRKWVKPKRLFERMRSEGKAVSTLVVGDRFYILEWLPGTYGNITLRRGPWHEEASWRNARKKLEGSLGRKLRPYIGRANAYYPHV